jgi:hypothetical protein
LLRSSLPLWFGRWTPCASRLGEPYLPLLRLWRRLSPSASRPGVFHPLGRPVRRTSRYDLSEPWARPARARRPLRHHARLWPKRLGIDSIGNAVHCLFHGAVRCPSTLSLVPEARLVEGDGPEELATLPPRPHAETRCPRFQEDASRLSCATNMLSRTPANCRPSSEGLASFESPRCSRSSCPAHLAMLETPRPGLPRRCLVAVAGAFDLEWRCGG